MRAKQMKERGGFVLRRGEKGFNGNTDASIIIIPHLCSHI